MTDDDDPRADALALADRFDARAAKLEAEAGELRYKASVLRGTVSEATAEVEAARERAGLTIGAKRSKLSSKMQLDTSGQPRNVRIAAGRTKRESEPRRLLLKRGQTAATVAKSLKVGVSTVNAWFTGRRSIPEPHARRLSELYGVPSDTWPKLGE